MILAFGTYDSARHPRVGILIDGLRQNGEHVVECNEPLGLSTADRVKMLQRPWFLPLLVIRLVACWARLLVRATRLRRRERPRTVLVGYLGHFDVVLARVLFPRTTIVLDHLVFAAGTAQDRGVSQGQRVALLRSLDRLALRCADIVVVDTDEHAAQLPPRAVGVVVPVGARGEWFDAARLRDQAGPLSVVFFGLFTPLQGAPVIGAALAGCAARGLDLRVTVVGSGQDLVETRRLAPAESWITWSPWVEPADLPGLVAQHDVCLGIFGETPKALAVVPNKVYQGLAAGCVVVTSDTPPQRRVLGDCVEYVPPADAEALVDVLEKLATQPGALSSARARAQGGRSRFTADAVVGPLLDVLRASEVTR